MRPALVPELFIRDLKVSLSFYVGTLGFSIYNQRPEEGFAEVHREGAHLMLETMASFDAVSDADFIEKRLWRTGAMEYPFGRGLDLEITIADVDSVYRSLLAQNYPPKVPLEERQYRVNGKMVAVRQFLVMDPDGYLIRMASNIGGVSAKDCPP
jgi:catechol 2,3-dioxygenase-like lactoylglutathione lyase family enzyme